jgi:hypothetical protein
MKAKPNVGDFVAGSATAAIEGTAHARFLAGQNPRITKTIRIDRALDMAVKRTALDRQAATGARVTESDLIEAALRQYLKL